MYIEFVIIYVLLFITIALGIINLILLLRNRDKNDNHNASNNENFPGVTVNQSTIPNSQNGVPGTNFGVAFCTKCAHQFPGNEKYCPYCGTPRN